MRFFDRVDAGRRLGARLEEFALRDVVVLGLVRGGVPVGYEVARILDAPLDVMIVRKIGVPLQPELAMGAVVAGASHLFEEPGTLHVAANLARTWFLEHRMHAS